MKQFLFGSAILISLSVIGIGCDIFSSDNEGDEDESANDITCGESPDLSDRLVVEACAALSLGSSWFMSQDWGRNPLERWVLDLSGIQMGTPMTIRWMTRFADRIPAATITFQAGCPLGSPAPGCLESNEPDENGRFVLSGSDPDRGSFSINPGVWSFTGSSLKLKGTEDWASTSESDGVTCKLGSLFESATFGACQ